MTGNLKLINWSTKGGVKNGCLPAAVIVLTGLKRKPNSAELEKYKTELRKTFPQAPEDDIKPILTDAGGVLPGGEWVLVWWTPKDGIPYRLYSGWGFVYSPNACDIEPPPQAEQHTPIATDVSVHQS